MKMIRSNNGIKIQLTADEYNEMREEYDGVCLNCGEVMYGGCEPDMTDGTCEKCDSQRVMGIEEMLMDGRVIII